MGLVDVALAAVERVWPGRSASVEELGGGITNRNYKVTVGPDVFVLRMAGAKTGLLGIDRSVEFAAGRRAFELGVGPEVVAFEPDEGWLVTRFIAGRPVDASEMRRAETLGRVASALRRFHSSGAIPGRFDVFAVVDDYDAKAETHGPAIVEDFAEARAIAAHIEASLDGSAVVPCHNDLLNANFLDDGEIRIVDWEYAGMGNVFFDLANFSVNHDFTVDDDRRLLTAYFGETRNVDLASLRLMRYMSDFREAMWGVLQSVISDLDFDFAGYAAKHFARMRATARDPAFASWFASIGHAYGSDRNN
jgi:thiamine kinase-like enzyme